MIKKYSWKIWLVFWIVAILLLACWYVFLQVKNRNLENLKPFVRIMPIGSERRNEIETLMDIYDRAGGSGEEKTFLVLFQNDLELRPGGGFIGAFGVVKIQNGKIADIQVFDTANFDKKISTAITPPAPLADILGTTSWKMRDSNWSPDFKMNAENAEYFYHLGGGMENIDGVVAINTRVLNSILSVTGPVRIEGYPGEYRDENAILQLEYQVEKGYAEQGIAKAQRKNIMAELADVLAQKAEKLSLRDQLSLAQMAESHLKEKDIQLFSNDENLQKEIEKIGWGGRVKDDENDYLMVIDANLLSLKSDYCIKRRMDYSVDLSGENPLAVLKITYQHTCLVKDWMTTDYRDWLRVYTPKDSLLVEATGQNGDVQSSDELGKKVFGMLVNVPVGETKIITLKYNLAPSVTDNPYNLLIQKQSGSGDVPIDISVKKRDGSEIHMQDNLVGDKVFGL